MFGKATPTKTSGWMNKWFGIQPWTSLAFERLMLLAVIYPMLFLVLAGCLVILDRWGNGLYLNQHQADQGFWLYFY
jgi:hypothetical protein